MPWWKINVKWVPIQARNWKKNRKTEKICPAPRRELFSDSRWKIKNVQEKNLSSLFIGRKFTKIKMMKNHLLSLFLFAIFERAQLENQLIVRLSSDKLTTHKLSSVYVWKLHTVLTGFTSLVSFLLSFFFSWATRGFALGKAVEYRIRWFWISKSETLPISLFCERHSILWVGMTQVAEAQTLRLLNTDSRNTNTKLASQTPWCRG